MFWYSLLSQEPESDSDSDVVEIEDGSATPRRNARRQAQKQPQRSRSRSLTPPPTIPQQQVEKVRNFVRYVLFTNSFSDALSPTRNRVSSQALGEPSTSVVPAPAEYGGRADTPAAQSSSSRASPAAEEDEDSIQIDVTWKPHPHDKSSKEVEWQYKISRVSSILVDAQEQVLNPQYRRIASRICSKPLQTTPTSKWIT